MTWTQPLCQACWDKERPHDRAPVHPRPARRITEVCCMCGEETRSGIYARYNPAAVPYPTTED